MKYCIAGILAVVTASYAVAQGRPTVNSPAVDTLPEVSRPIIADTEAMLFPDPADRTRARMETNQYLLDRYFSGHRSFPDALRAVLPADPTEWLSNYTHDAWGKPFRYTRKGNDYELVSAGPDREFGTADDLRATRIRAPTSSPVGRPGTGSTRGAQPAIEGRADPFAARGGRVIVQAVPPGRRH